VSAAPPTARCRYCGAEGPPDARYCLECGEGIRPYELLDEQGTPVRTAAGGATIVERRGPRGIVVWPILLLVVVLGALGAYALTRSDDEPTATTASVPVITSTVTTSVTATSPSTDTVGSSATAPTATEPTATDTTATSTTPTETTATTTEPTTTPASQTAVWSGTGYTVILQSFPKATKTEQDAIAYQQGLTGVTGTGVLDSDSYPDLKPGWWVVFAGKYTTADEADAAAAQLRSQGHEGAYGRKVA
jgi:SPOR domain